MRPCLRLRSLPVTARRASDRCRRSASLPQHGQGCSLCGLADLRHLPCRDLQVVQTNRHGPVHGAGNDPSLADLPTPATVYDKDLGQYFEVLRKDGQWYQSQYALDNNGKELFRQTVKMQYAVGAGENGIGFVVERDGEHGRFLFEAPLSYYTQAHRWSFSPGYEIQNRGFTRPILAQCITCHSGQPKPVAGQVGLYQDPPFDELAVGCENCHGPGALHVAEHSSGQKATSPSMVNPAHLSGWLADNICMRCHQGKDVRVNAPGMQDQDFRPGMPLDKVVSIFKLPADAQPPAPRCWSITTA